MGTRMRVAATLAAALLLSIRPEGEAAACSVCQAGDPTFSSHGASAQQRGDFAAYLEVRGWRKTSGLLGHGAEEHEHEEEMEEHGHEESGREVNQGQEIGMYLSWTPIERLTLTAMAPWRFHSIVEQPDGEPETRSTLSGPGDVSLLGSVVLWRDREVLPGSWVEGRLFLKLPTGQRREKVDGVRDPHLQLGTGSWDFGAGLAATHRLGWGALYASALYRENTEGTLDYEYGDVVLLNAGLELPLGHALQAPRLAAFTPGLELNFRYAGSDEQDGERYRDSGGGILYAAPSLRIALPWGGEGRPPSLRLAVQLPLGQTWLHHQQREGVVWSAGLLLPF